MRSTGILLHIRSVLLLPAVVAAAVAADWDRFEVRFAGTSTPWRTAGRGTEASFVALPEEPGTQVLCLRDSVGYGQAVMPERIPVRGLMEIRASARLRRVEGEGAKGVVDLLGYDDEAQRLQYRIVIGETTSPEWEEVTKTFTVPPGTAELELRFCPAWPREPGVKCPGTSHLARVLFERVSAPPPPRSCKPSASRTSGTTCRRLGHPSELTRLQSAAGGVSTTGDPGLSRRESSLRG